MDAIHRTLPSSSSPLSDRSCSTGPNFGTGRPKCPSFLSTAFDQLPAWAGSPLSNCSCSSWLVPGTQWRILRSAGYAAHVGRDSADIYLLALLGARGETQSARDVVRNSARDNGCAGRVDGFLRWTTGA